MEKENDSKRVIFLKGKKMVLRPLRKDTDIETVLMWVNGQEVTQYLSMYLPNSFDSESEWFDNLIRRKDDIILAIETLEGVFIGTTGLHGINWKDRWATHGILIGDKDYWGKGYGTDVGMFLLGFAFNSLNLKKVCSSVISYNERSLKYHLKCGYQKVGVHKRHFFKKGCYWDEILLEVFKSEWRLCFNEYKKTFAMH